MKEIGKQKLLRHRLLPTSHKLFRRKIYKAAAGGDSAWYRLLFENSPDAVLLTSPSGRIHHANRRACDLLGYTEKALRQAGWKSIIDPADPNAIIPGDDWKTPGRFRGQSILIRNDGTKFPADVTAAVFANRAGRAKAVLVVHDSIEQKHAAERAADAFRYTRAVIAFSPVGIVTCTASGNVVSANPAFVRMTDGTIGDILAQNVFRLHSWRESGMVATAEKALASGRECRHEARMPSSHGGELIVDCVFVPFQHRGNHRLLVVLADVTERHRAELEIRKSHEDLRRLADHLNHVREEERKHLAREFHDRLGQTMTALKIDLALLSRENAPGKRGTARKRLSGELKAAGELVDEMARQLREIITGLRPQMIDELGLAAALAWEAERFEKRAGIPCQFTTNAPDLRLAPPSAIALFRIGQEALTNVIRHARASAVTIKLNAAPGLLLFDITDNGRGLPDDANAGPKTFGLLGMRERAVALGGSLTVTSSPGKGTTVCVRLPLPAPGPESEAV